MIKNILNQTGLPYAETRLPDPPAGTYCIYTDDVETDGPDGLNYILTHQYTIELYEPSPDAVAEAGVEAALDAAGVRWTKQARYWLQSVKRYQVVYDFMHRERRRY